MTMLETQKTTFTANDWLNYFKENARQRQSIPWERGIIAEPYLRGPLIRSLQPFQVGEQGDGLHLRKAAARTHNPDYIAAIDLFVKEEQEHSRYCQLSAMMSLFPPHSGEEVRFFGKLYPIF